MRNKIKLYIFAALIFIGACVSTPVSDRSAFIVIPFSQEVSMGTQAYKEILAKEKPSTNKKLIQIAKRVGQRLAATTNMTDLKWEFTVVDSKQQNAFALPGGKTAVYTGILPVCKNEAGLAAVLGHEIAHVTARHAGQRMSQQFLLMGVMSVASISMANNSQRGAILGAMGVGAMYGVSLPFGRSNESEADQIGLIYMAQAGYDPREAIRFWGRFSNMKGGKKIPEFLSTHPSDNTRIRELQEYLPHAIRIYESRKVKYGLGATFEAADFNFSEPSSKQSPSSAQPVKSGPGVAIETLK